jgi:hypothetical protein
MKVLLAVLLSLAAAAPAAADGVLGIRYDHGPQGRISYFDRVTMTPRGRTVRVHGYVWGWDRSPSGSAVALGVSSRGRLQIVATKPVAFSRIVETGRKDTIRAVRWISAERALALVGFERPEIVEFDLAAGKVAARRPLGCREAAVDKLADGLALLCDERLLLARPGAPLHSIPLPGVHAGENVSPGLVIDGGYAYVAPVGPPAIVRVELSSGKTERQDLSPSDSRGLTPSAGAAKDETNDVRTLQRLAPGRLLLGGAGIRIVDTTAWTAQTIDDREPFAPASPFGFAVPTFDHPAHVVLYGPDGRRRATFTPRFGMADVDLAGPYAYVKNGARRGANHRTHVFDLRTGRKAGSVPLTRLPFLLE